MTESVSVEKRYARAALRSFIRDTEARPGRVHISIDIDQTLAGVHEVMIALYNKAKGTRYTVADHTDWDFKSIGSNYAEMMTFYVKAWKDHWREIMLMGNRDSLIESEQYFVQDISSSRDYHGPTGGTTDTTVQWLNMQRLDWLPYFFDSTKINKLDMKYEIYIDDSPKLAEDITARNSSFQLLIDRPYNRYLRNSDRILRVSGFDEAAAEIISAATDVGIGKRYYQTHMGQRFLREGGTNARDRIVAEELKQ
jgi:5'(3')-deoxyribonucleotidase